MPSEEEFRRLAKQELSYDAWGRLRDPATHAAYAQGSEPALFLGRGYTGHEHLTWFGVVNMNFAVEREQDEKNLFSIMPSVSKEGEANARLYDPVLGRFLSPDPYVQAPDNTQNFNRYSYCLNNPLKYTDPTGEKWWQWVLGISAVLDPISTLTTLTVAGGSATVTIGATGIAIAGIGSSIYATASLTATIASTTLSAIDFTRIWFGTLFSGNTAWGGKKFSNWINLELERINAISETFRYDQKASGFEWPLQVIHNLSGGEHLQDEIGNAFGHAQNIGGYVDNTGFYKGRLIIRLKGNYIANNLINGISFGHYVFGNNIAFNPDDTGHDIDLFAHEYGHTYQSRIMGPLYLFRVGIPSAFFHFASTEPDANKRGFGNLGITPTIEKYKEQTGSTYKWWEWLTAPVTWPFMWSWNL